MKVILYSINKVTLKCTILNRQLVIIHQIAIYGSTLLIFYLDPIDVFVLCISGYSFIYIFECIMSVSEAI